MLVKSLCRQLPRVDRRFPTRSPMLKPPKSARARIIRRCCCLGLRAGWACSESETRSPTGPSVQSEEFPSPLVLLTQILGYSPTNNSQSTSHNLAKVALSRTSVNHPAVKATRWAGLPDTQC